MALRYRQSPHWGADLASDGGEDEFRHFLSLFEPKMNAKKCIVESVSPSQTVGNRVLLRWRRSVSYSGAYAWVSDVVQNKFSWRLVDPDDVPRDLPPQVSTPARHLLHKALLTIRQTGKKRSSDYIAADVVLGQGTFSQVLAARPKKGGEMVAVKKYKKTSDIALQLQEVHFLQFLASDYVIPLLDVTGGDLPGSLSLVFPMAKKSLKKHIAAGALALQEIERLAKHIAQGLRGNKAIWFCNMLCICFGPGVFHQPLRDLFFYVHLLFLFRRNLAEINERFLWILSCFRSPCGPFSAQLAGLEALHSAFVIHNDLKPDNVLLFGPELNAKICDLGNSVVDAAWREVPSDEEVAKDGVHEITLNFRPPEVLLGLARYGTAVDIWALGCILFEMGTGQPLFPAATSQVEAGPAW